jgi:hypothetical protein
VNSVTPPPREFLTGVCKGGPLRPARVAIRRFLAARIRDSRRRGQFPSCSLARVGVCRPRKLSPLNLQANQDGNDAWWLSMSILEANRHGKLTTGSRL